MKFEKSTAVTLLKWLSAIAAAVTAYLQSGQPFSWPALATFVFGALAGLHTVGPGQTTKAKAEALADARARDHLIAYRAMAGTHLPPIDPQD